MPCCPAQQTQEPGSEQNNKASEESIACWIRIGWGIPVAERGGPGNSDGVIRGRLDSPAARMVASQKEGGDEEHETKSAQVPTDIP